jgi:uncharacterized membrane protein YeiH
MANNPIFEWLISYGTTAMEFVGVVAFALSGLLEASRHKFDIVGMAMVAALTAFAGGTLRDVLLDRRPFFWVDNEFYVWGILVVSVLLLIFVSRARLQLTSKAVEWPDAVGLGIFAAGGTQMALDGGMPWLIAVVMGVVTATFGGVARDIVVNQVPRAFTDHEPYAVIAFTGGWLVILLNEIGLERWVTMLTAAVVMTAIRFAVLLWGWKVPAWRA